MADLAKVVVVETSPSHFTFINYDADPQQSRRFKKAVKSHISGAYRKKLRAGATTSPMLIPSTLAQVQCCDVRLPSGSSRVSPTLVAHTQGILAARESVCSPMDTTFAGLRTDPLNSLPLPDRPNLSQHVDYCIKWFSGVRFPIHSQLRSPNPGLAVVWPMVLQNTEFFCSQMAMSRLHCTPAQPGEETSEVLRYRAAAISQLRRRLMDPKIEIDDAMILTVLSLLAVDVVLGDLDALRAHLCGIKQMIAVSGGWSSLRFAEAAKTTYEQYLKISDQHETPPSSPQSTSLMYPGHPFSPAICTKIAPLPEGVRELVLQGTVSLNMLNIVERMARWKNTLESARRPDCRYSQQDLDTIFNYDAMGDFTSLKECLAVLQIRSSRKTSEQCLCHGLILYSYMVFTKLRMGSICPGSRREHLEFLPQYRAAGKSETECSIWMWVQAIESWRFGRRLLPQGCALLNQLLDRYPEAGDLLHLEKLLHKFFWIDTGKGLWKACFQDVIRNR